MRNWHRVLLCLGASALLPAIAGCAAVHVDEQGRRHVLGLVWLTLPAPGEPAAAADELRTRSVGLTLNSGPLGQTAVLGYSDQRLLAIRNDSVLKLAVGAAAQQDNKPGAQP
jgi:hypothetical protein